MASSSLNVIILRTNHVLYSLPLALGRSTVLPCKPHFSVLHLEHNFRKSSYSVSVLNPTS